MPSDALPPRSLPADPDPEGVFEFSASAINTYKDCKMKYGFGYFDGLRPEGNAAAKLGVEIHRQLEQWLLKGEVPAHATAKRMLPMLPLPTHPGLLVEHPFRILFRQGAARGFIDLLIPEPLPPKMPKGLWYPKIPVVSDHKSTGRIEFHKTAEDLKTDPQALLYGVEARRVAARLRGVKVVDVPEVDLLWNYASTKTKETVPVRLRQTLPILEDGLGPMLETVEEMAAAAHHGVTKDLDYDLRTCDKYGGCPHKAYCPAHQAYVFGGLVGSARNESLPVASESAQPRKDSKMTEDLMSKLRKLGGQPSKPPPPLDDVPATPPASTSAPTPTTEPELPKPDTSGLADPIPPGTSPVRPPDAPPDVSPQDPPEPAAEAPKPSPKKRGRPPKAKPTQPAIDDKYLSGTPEVLDAEIVEEPVTIPSTLMLDDGTAETLLKGIASLALEQGRYVLAAQTTTTLVALRSRT